MFVWALAIGLVYPGARRTVFSPVLLLTTSGASAGVPARVTNNNDLGRSFFVSCCCCYFPVGVLPWSYLRACHASALRAPERTASPLGWRVGTGLRS